MKVLVRGQIRLRILDQTKIATMTNSNIFSRCSCARETPCRWQRSCWPAGSCNCSSVLQFILSSQNPQTGLIDWTLVRTGCSPARGPTPGSAASSVLPMHTAHCGPTPGSAGSSMFPVHTAHCGPSPGSAVSSMLPVHTARDSEEWNPV